MNIKLENIFIQGNNIKLINSEYIQKLITIKYTEKQQLRVCGTEGYATPEII